MIHKSIAAILLAFFLSSPAWAQDICSDGFEFNPDGGTCDLIPGGGDDGGMSSDDGTEPQLLRFLTPDDQDTYISGTEVAPTGRSTLSFAQDLPLDLTIILDRSGSMLAPTPVLNDETLDPTDRFTRMELVERAVFGLLAILPESAEVTLIDFATDVQGFTTKLGLGLSVAQETDRQGIVERLEAIAPHGDTDFGSALGLNRFIANASASSGSYLPEEYDREILVLSDGQPTRPVNPSDLFFLGGFGDVTAVSLPGATSGGFSFLSQLAQLSGGQLLDYRFDAQSFLDSFLGDNLLLTGLAGVEITDPDGMTYAAELDALGQFTLDPFALKPGDNLFTARASFLDGTEATDTLILIGSGGVTVAAVPLPATAWLLIVALAGIAASRKRTAV